MATPDAARSSIYLAVKTAWDAGASTTGKTLIYENTTANIPPDEVGTTGEPDIWGAVRVLSSNSRVQSLIGAEGVRRYRRVGVVVVELYTPAGNGLVSAGAVVKVVLDGLEGQTTANGVYFRDADVREEGVSGPWFLTVVTVNFEYDEVK